MNGTWYTVAIVLVCAAVTFLTRVIPFVAFRDRMPKQLVYLGKVLPPAIMILLVIYCLRGTAILAWPYGLPELIASAAAVLLHVWKRNNLISILGATALYMVLVQLVFVI